ncbi:phosphotransferase enzyme family protein [Agromyces ramosus]|uniref:Ser/Thr protein kinase RdoA (MazF antagonist) n=1 Tax=Agromyces ramosus TaxID=33879 RepID=A0ABU0R6U0_9MICO|nr:phosphotransferase [Agromyces ramosus]MDQ0893806.1 Ser/Thr protein kinase RdoA (MazF antagonist) [Agromyces ramosus]
MLKLSEIARLRRTVDAAWRSPVADAAAAAWGMPAGAARFWRSSASHVFVVPAGAPGAPGGQAAYLRFVPAGSRQADELERAAAVMSAWADAAVPVVRPMPSRDGRATERVVTEHAELVAMLVPAASGDELDLDELTDVAAGVWGAALGRLHTTSARVGPAPMRGAAVDRPSADDAELVRAAEGIAAAVAMLDPSTHSRGVIHGDFELDNLRFTDGVATFFDVDEARVDWFAADIALATRDLTGVTLDGEPRPELLAAFLRGYRSEREFSVEEEASLELFGVAASVGLALDVLEALDLDEHDHDPDWLMELRSSLRRHLHWHRDRALVFAATVD